MNRKTYLILFPIVIFLVFYKIFVKNPQETIDDLDTEIEKNTSVISETVQVSKKQETIIGEKKEKDFFPNINQNEESAPPDKIKVFAQQMGEMEAYFDKVEKQWVMLVTDLFLEEMNLDKSQLEGYLELREVREYKRQEVFDRLHEEMIQENGQNYEFRLTEFETHGDVIAIDEEYSSELRGIIGDHNYSLYLEFRDRFNEQLKVEENGKYKGLEIAF